MINVDNYSLFAIAKLEILKHLIRTGNVVSGVRVKAKMLVASREVRQG